MQNLHSCLQKKVVNDWSHHSLVVVLPESGHHLSSPGTLFNSQTLEKTKWFQAGLQPNVFCLHNRWNGPEVSKLYRNTTKPFYFSVLRDPVSLLISLWDYYGVTRKLGMKLERFAVRKIKPNRFRIYDIYLKNTMLHDFGFSPSDFGNLDVIHTKINEIEETFDLILFVEQFAESMVLLKHSLCWEYEDLASLKLNSHDTRTKTVLSLNAKKQLKIWLKDSYYFYDYFKVNKISTYLT